MARRLRRDSPAVLVHVRLACASVAAFAAAALALAACTAAPSGSGPPTTPPSAPRTATSPTGAPPTISTSPRGAACVAPLARWPLARLADQLLMVVGEFTSARALAPEARAGVGGFVLLGEPAAATGPALRTALSDLVVEAAGGGRVRPWMSTDTEGGPVSRLAHVLGTIPSAREMAAEWTPGQVESAMKARGTALRQLGITMDLAPVLDTAAPTDPVADESQRSFSGTPAVVAAYGSAYAAGLRAAGVVAVGKHFPGLGHASADTDAGPATDPPLAELRGADLVPFARAVSSGLPAVMVGHPIVPGLTGGLPASLSPATYVLLRRTLHFDGVAMTDALSAGAISAAGYGETAAAVTAVRAGADMPMVDASTFEPVVDALVHAISQGAIPRAQADASVARILVAKGVTVCPG